MSQDRDLHFQLVTICNRFISLFLKAVLEYLPIVACICTIRQHLGNIHNGEIPFLLLRVPYSADFLILKELYLLFVTHGT